MFENLSERLERSFKILKGEGKRQNIGGIQKTFVNRDAPYIIKIRLCHCNTVNLRFHHFDKHILKSLCPIKRADDGLALSSRNALLSEEQRAVAPEIHKALEYSVVYSREHSVGATHDTVVGLGKHLEIVFLLARICGEIRRIVELRRIDKYTRDHTWILFYSPLHKRQMAGMQSSHSGHKSHSIPLFFLKLHKIEEFSDLSDYYHFIQVSICADNRFRWFAVTVPCFCSLKYVKLVGFEDNDVKNLEISKF